MEAAANAATDSIDINQRIIEIQNSSSLGVFEVRLANLEDSKTEMMKPLDCIPPAR
jgi:hypothetical protein